MKANDEVEEFVASPDSSESDEAVEIVVDDVGDRVRSILKASGNDRVNDLSTDDRRMPLDRRVKFASEVQYCVCQIFSGFLAVIRFGLYLVTQSEEESDKASGLLIERSSDSSKSEENGIRTDFMGESFGAPTII